MLENLNKMMSAIKNIDTGKLQWFHGLMTELTNKRVENNKRKLSDSAAELFDDPMVISMMPLIESNMTNLKLDINKSLNIIADAYAKGMKPEEVVEELLSNAKKK